MLLKDMSSKKKMMTDTRIVKISSGRDNCYAYYVSKLYGCYEYTDTNMNVIEIRYTRCYWIAKMDFNILLISNNTLFS